MSFNATMPLRLNDIRLILVPSPAQKAGSQLFKFEVHPSTLRIQSRHLLKYTGGFFAVGVGDWIPTSAALGFGVADAGEAEAVGVELEDFGGDPLGCHGEWFLLGRYDVILTSSLYNWSVVTKWAKLSGPSCMYLVTFITNALS